MEIQDKINELKKFIASIDNLKEVESLYPEGCAIYWKYVNEIGEELNKINTNSKRNYPDECPNCGADEDRLQPYDDESFICEDCRITLPYIKQ